MELAIRFLLVVIMGVATLSAEPVSKDIASFRCLEALVRLGSDPKNTKIISALGTMKWVEGAPETVSGDKPGQVFRSGWKIVERETEGRIEYSFSDGVQNVGVTLYVDGAHEGPHRIELRLPRNADDAQTNLGLLEAVLATIYQRAKSGEKFEIVINEPAIIERLNAITREYFANGERVEKPKPKQFDLTGRTIDEDEGTVRPRKIGFEPRRPIDEDEARVFPGVRALDKFSDSYFPEFTTEEGHSAVQMFNRDKSFQEAAMAAIYKEDLSRAISNSGDWTGRVQMRPSPRLGEVLRATSDLDFPMPEIYPIVWVIEIEQAW